MSRAEVGEDFVFAGGIIAERDRLTRSGIDAVAEPGLATASRCPRSASCAFAVAGTAYKKASVRFWPEADTGDSRGLAP